MLRRWADDGAVRLLSADPHRRALLLERLKHDDLRTVGEVEACEAVAGLYRRLHVPAMPQLRTLASQLGEWIGGFRGIAAQHVDPAAVGRAGDHELVGDVRDGVRRRFYTLVDAAGLDEDRARAWVVVRVVRAAVRDPARATTCVALAKAVQD